MLSVFESWKDVLLAVLLLDDAEPLYGYMLECSANWVYLIPDRERPRFGFLIPRESIKLIRPAKSWEKADFLERLARQEPNEVEKDDPVYVVR